VVRAFGAEMGTMLRFLLTVCKDSIQRRTKSQRKQLSMILERLCRNTYKSQELIEIIKIHHDQQEK
jgi:hypothetical protein